MGNNCSPLIANAFHPLPSGFGLIFDTLSKHISFPLYWFCRHVCCARGVFFACTTANPHTHRAMTIRVVTTNTIHFFLSSSKFIIYLHIFYFGRRVALGLSSLTTLLEGVVTNRISLFGSKSSGELHPPSRTWIFLNIGYMKFLNSFLPYTPNQDINPV